MDNKTLKVLEYNKIIDRLSGYCDFSASRELAQAIQPTAHLDEARRLLAETTEARFLFSTRDLTIGGSHDIRPAANMAARGGVLDPQALLDIKSTLIACRELKKSLENAAEEAPRLAEIAVGLPETHGLVSAITQVLSERGEVLEFGLAQTCQHPPRDEDFARPADVQVAKVHYRRQDHTHVTGSYHHPARRALRHPAALRVQGSHQVGGA